MRHLIPKLRHGAVGLAAACLVLLPGAAAFAGTTTTPLPHKVGGAMFNPNTPRAAAKRPAGMAAAPVLPASVDLRANMPAVGNQGQVGSWSGRSRTG
jgi:hypothetical protein